MTQLDTNSPASTPEILRRLVSRFGQTVFNERRRVLGTLGDHMPENRREMHLLAAAFDEGIPARLAGGATGLADIERESQRLSQSRGVSPDLARWTVSALAQAITSEAPGTAQVAAVAPAPTADLAVAPLSPQPAHAVAASAATTPGKHARLWRFVRIGGALVIVAIAVLRLLASLPPS